MRRINQLHLILASIDRKWLLPLLATMLVSITLLFVVVLGFGVSMKSSFWNVFLGHSADTYSKVTVVQVPPSGFPDPPRLAYLISGTKGDGLWMKRVLQALYHPRNQYLLHLDLEAPPRERIELARHVRLDPTFIEVGNVHVVGKANLVTYRGPTMVSCTLHAAAILLRQSENWDWFINLSASDYPLIPQDDLLHVLSFLPRDLNFIEHTSDIGWKE